MSGQQGQDIVLRLGEVHGLTGDAHHPALVLNDQLVQHKALLHGSALCAGTAGAQRSADAGQQLGGGKGLGHIVVCAQIPRRHLVLFRAAGRKHQNGHGHVRARAADEFQPVAVRQTQIQNHQIRHMGAQHHQPQLAGVRRKRLVLMRVQHGAEHAGYAAVVLYAKNAVFVIAH